MKLVPSWKRPCRLERSETRRAPQDRTYLAVDGTVLIYAASLTFEEILDTRVTSEELRAAAL